MKLLNKPIEYFCTRSISDNDSINKIKLISTAHQVLSKHPVDMLVFEYDQTINETRIRAAGYILPENEILDETTLIGTIALGTKEKLWLKVDDYGDKYIATFLYPSEY